MKRLGSWWRALTGRADLDRQLDEEMQFHLAARADDLQARDGVTRGEALRRARVEFGSREKFKEESRAGLGLRLLDEWRTDCRFAGRMFTKHKIFTATAVATLAIGIGANTAVFSALDAVRLRKLPVERPDELVVFSSLIAPDSMVAGYSGQGHRGPDGSSQRTSFPVLTFERFRNHTTTLSSVFAIAASTPPFNIVTDDAAESVPGALVSGGYFDALGVQPAAGRLLSHDDDRADAAPAVVLSYSYWHERFGGRRDTIGSSFVVNRTPFTIVGVTPERFHGTTATAGPQVTMPLAMAARLSAGGARPPSQWWIELMGRLKPGATREQVRAELLPLFEDTVRESWAARGPRTRDMNRTGMPRLIVESGAYGRHSVPFTRTDPHVIAFAVVGLLLLIACVNLATLLLSRVQARRPEVSMRLALGASRGRVVRQFLAESLCLALAAAALGVMLAVWGRPLVVWLLDTTADVRLDLRVLVFTLSLSVVVAVLFGIVPALRATAGSSMRMSAQKGGVVRSLSGRSLLGAQVALSLVLLVGAGLLARTVYNYSRVDVGFDPRNVLVFDVNHGPSAPGATPPAELLTRVAESIEQVPGVESVTMSAMPLIGQAVWIEEMAVPGRDRRLGTHLQIVRWNLFDAMRMPIVAGRDLAATDVAGAPPVAVINEAMARGLFDTPAPMGQFFQFADGRDQGVLIEVVGVVRDAKYAYLDEAAPPTFYLPHAQVPPASTVSPNRMTFEVRTALDPAAQIPSVRAAVRAVDPNLPLVDVRTQEGQIAESIREQRSFALLTGAAALMGLLLACIGLYGVVSNDVSRRTAEIGLRMALGARPLDVLRLVLWQVVGVVAGGVAAGLIISRTATTLVQEMLFDIAANDPLTVAGAVLLLVAVATFAAYIPARRASMVSPMTALRHD